VTDRWTDRRTDTTKFRLVKTAERLWRHSVCSLQRQRSWTNCSMFKMLQHVWSQGPGNTSVVCLGWYMTTCTGWLFLSECIQACYDTCDRQIHTSLLWQSIVVFDTELHGTSPTTVYQPPKFLIASICDLPDVINGQFREFAATLLGPVPVHFLSPDQQSGIHCLIICEMQHAAVDSEQFRWNLKTYLFCGHSKR